MKIKRLGHISNSTLFHREINRAVSPLTVNSNNTSRSTSPITTSRKFNQNRNTYSIISQVRQENKQKMEMENSDKQAISNPSNEKEEQRKRQKSDRRKKKEKNPENTQSAKSNKSELNDAVKSR